MSHNLALKKDGTVCAWGDNYKGQTNVPMGLTNVIAIAAGTYHSLALKADGRVVSWGGLATQRSEPNGLTNVVAIAAGFSFSLALKSDGTVCAWGDNGWGQTNVPADLNGVTAIAAGDANCMALREDGSVVVWGWLQSSPEPLTNVVAISASGLRAMALEGDGPAFISSAMLDRTVVYGTTACLTVAASGACPLTYQWKLNGTNLPGATDAWLDLRDIHFTDAGLYTVIVSNSFGSVTSSAIHLSVAAVSILDEPERVVTFRGETVSLRVNAQGVKPLSFQWQFNGVSLPGATDSVFVLTNAQVAQSGSYTVVVSNNLAAITSARADLSVGLVAIWGRSTAGQTNLPAGLTNITAVSCGGAHNLLLRSDGTVLSWGENDYGQTNVPPGLTNVVSISASGDSSMALKADGTVVGWGRGDFGQTNVPSDIVDAVAIAGGLSCFALRGNGTVAAWGRIYPETSNVVGELRNIVALAAGVSHCLALRSDGRVTAWGGNSYGQTNVPPGLSNVVAIAAGDYDSVALGADGTVFVWGGICGVPATAPADLTNIVAIAAGSEHFLGTRSDGTVRAWGNDWGLGVTNIPSSLRDVVSVAGGMYHSLALIGDGPPDAGTPIGAQTVLYGTTAWLRVRATGSAPLFYQWRCNGTNLPAGTNAVLKVSDLQLEESGVYSVVISNEFGVVTSADMILNVVPIVIHTQPRSRSLFRGATARFEVGAFAGTPLSYQWQFNGTNIADATETALVLTNLQINHSGVYGATVSTSVGPVRSAEADLAVGLVAGWGDDSQGQATPPPGLTNVVAIAAGALHSLALNADGTVVSWGDNRDGQSSVPAGLTNVVAISGGDVHSLALKADGTVIAWGNNDYGQTNVPAGFSNVVAIAAGFIHNLALKTDGTVVGWGYSEDGEMSAPAGLGRVVAIADARHCIALRDDGTVVAWGDNFYGQTNVPASLRDVRSIVAGSYYSMALKRDGTITCFGQFGEFWDDLTMLPSSFSNITGIAGCWDHALATRADGTIFAWGYNSHGQTNLPFGLSKAVGIAGGLLHSLALVDDGLPGISESPISMEKTLNDFSVTLRTQVGRVYALEYKDSLLSSSWTTLPLIVAKGSNSTLSDPTATVSQRFYRIRRW